VLKLFFILLQYNIYIYILYKASIIYPFFVRKNSCDLYLDDKIKLLVEAKSLKRYYCEYNNGTKEGINPTNLDNNRYKLKIGNNTHIVNLEFLLIKKYVLKINKVISSLSINSNTSQPSYYINISNLLNFNGIFNAPFIEFISPANDFNLEFFRLAKRKLINKNYLVNTGFDYKDNLRISFTVIRPYTDKKEKLLYGIDDKKFFMDIYWIFLKCKRRVLKEKHEKKNIGNNYIDKNLLKHKKWYILGNNMSIIRIKNKNINKFNIPYTTLNISYQNNIMSFLR
jgi:hypothetical protein